MVEDTVVKIQRGTYGILARTILGHDEKLKAYTKQRL